MSGRHRRAARERIRRKLEERQMDRLVNLSATLAADFVDAKLRGGGQLAPLVTALLFARALAPTCIRCSSAAVVSSVGSQAPYCAEHWSRLWTTAKGSK